MCVCTRQRHGNLLSLGGGIFFEQEILAELSSVYQTVVEGIWRCKDGINEGEELLCLPFSFLSTCVEQVANVNKDVFGYVQVDLRVFFQPRRDQVHTPDIGVYKRKDLLKTLALQLLVYFNFKKTL